MFKHFLRIPKSRFSSRRTYSILERAEDQVDVCIVGAGPAGLSAAIRLKQLEHETGKPLRVVVLEKGSEVGAHIISGGVLQPNALEELLGPIPSYAELYGSSPPLHQKATSSRMLYLTEKRAIPIPHPPQMSNKGNWIISLSEVTRWLANVAESHYGVEIYPGFAGASFLFSETPDADSPWLGWQGKWGTDVTKVLPKNGSEVNTLKKVYSVQGVITNDVGISRTGEHKSNYEPGMAFRAKVTLLAEGAHGSLSKVVVDRYGLRDESEGQTYGFGLKEVWRVSDSNSPSSKYRPGEVIHTMGYPLDSNTYGGGWLYHMNDGLVSLGLVLGADWKNPYREPYRDLQKMKHHPYFQRLLSPTMNDGFVPTRLAYGARILTEGGLQSLPLLHFPGGALIGCSAGFVNVPKIKGIHNAMKTGMLAADAAFESIHSNTDSAAPHDLSSYTRNFTTSWVYDELNEVRNVRPSFGTPLGIWGGMAYSGVDTLLLKGKGWWTFKHTSDKDRAKYTNAAPSIDSAHTEPASKHKPIIYPSYKPPLSTDLMTSVSLTGTNHTEDQPSHLRVCTLQDYIADTINPEVKKYSLAGTEKRYRSEHVRTNVGEYAGLLGHACPAGVYEYVDNESGQAKKLVINAQNCIHCKLCDVKVPTQDITWTVPEGGGGPKYTIT